MSDDEILKCCQSVYSFLIDDDLDWKNSNYAKSKIIMTVSHINMDQLLKKYNFPNMLKFTIFLNEKYKIFNEPLWTNTAREFFATTKD